MDSRDREDQVTRGKHPSDDESHVSGDARRQNLLRRQKWSRAQKTGPNATAKTGKWREAVKGKQCG